MQALNASDLLDTFTAAGLVLILTPDSALKVTPAKALNDDLRAAIKANKAMLVDYLQRTAANDTTTPPADPDRWCWPHSEAMNAVEIDTFTARLARFNDKGLSLANAEQQADRLVIRDRDGEDRRLCLECARLSASTCRVLNIEPLRDLLQRCPTFKPREVIL